MYDPDNIFSKRTIYKTKDQDSSIHVDSPVQTSRKVMQITSYFKSRMGYYPSNCHHLRAFKLSSPLAIPSGNLCEEEVKKNRFLSRDLFVKNRKLNNDLSEMMKLNYPINNLVIRNKKYTKESRKLFEEKLKEARELKYKSRMVYSYRILN